MHLNRLMSPEQTGKHPEIESLEPFRKQLFERRYELTERFREERQQTIDRTTGEPMDEVDQGVVERDVSSASQWSERHRYEVREIDDALERIESGEYGFCETCGEPIEAKRLLARPEARRCIGCESLNEERETEPGRRPSL